MTLPMSLGTVAFDLFRFYYTDDNYFSYSDIFFSWFPEVLGFSLLLFSYQVFGGTEYFNL